RMRWVCAGDITLQYRAVDGGFLSEELERLQCERIGPVIDVTVISGKLEEAHLPHYACLAESDPSLTRSVKVLIWTATVWKELINMHPNRAETLFQTGQNQNTPQSAVNFDKVQFFDRNWCALIKSVENVNNIPDNLLQKQIIHAELYSEITNPTSTSEASMRKICSIVRKGSDTVKEMFISILLEEDPDLLNHLPLPDSNFFA
uniref:CARD domain-containing protein n=1 Tax=Cyprinus carpio TaxID=7962 RepID=A0A8C1Q8H3_CYPCA